MFDFSLAELSVVGMVAIMVLGPKELLQFIKKARKVVNSLKQQYTSCLTELKEAIGDEEIVKIVFDDEGRPQRAYNLDKVKPLIQRKEEDERDLT